MAKFLDFMVRCNNASEDDVVDDLLKMADPSSFDSEDELRSHFEDCLGYDPIEFFDRKSIEEQFDELLNEAPYSVQEQLRLKKNEIIERTLECSDDIADSVLRKVFLNVVRDVVGWQPIDENLASLDDCVIMSVFGNENIDDYDDEDSDSDDCEDESIDDEDDDEE